MKTDDLEDELRNLKFAHLSENELVAYCDQKLDQISLARVNTHLQGCFICERHLMLLREEKAALSNFTSRADELAHVEWVMKQTLGPHGASASLTDAVRRIPLQERLAEYLRQMAASWQMSFRMMKPVRSAASTAEEGWHWESGDGKLQARMYLERDASLTVCLSSKEPSLEGTRLKFRLGLFRQEVTMQRISDEEVQAKVEIPRRQRPRNLPDMAIEIL